MIQPSSSAAPAFFTVAPVAPDRKQEISDVFLPGAPARPEGVYSRDMVIGGGGTGKDATSLDGRTANSRINHEPASVDSHSRWTKDDNATLLPVDRAGQPWSLRKLAKDGSQLVCQGPLGDCYHEAVISDALQQDPRLITSTTLLLGSKKGVDYYGVMFYVPANHKVTANCDRAGEDVERVRADGTSANYTPVWIVVDDLLPAHKDGSLITAAVTIPTIKQDVLLNAIREKALATLHGKTGYRAITRGGDADKVMETISGYPASKLEIERSKDPDEDKKLADEQFEVLLKAHEDGLLTTINTSVGDKRQVRHALKVYPEPPVEGYPHPYFDCKTFDFRDGNGDATKTAGSGAAEGSDSREGFGWVGCHEYSLLNVFRSEEGTAMVRMRNPWGDVCPPEFADKGPDGEPLQNGMVNLPWYLARQLVGTAKIGGRPASEHGNDVLATYAPKHGLPRGGLTEVSPAMAALQG